MAVRRMYLLMIMMVFMVGCSQKMGLIDYAKTVGVENSKAYMLLHERYIEVREGADAETQAYMTEKIKPVMDITKVAQITYNQAVIAWAEGKGGFFEVAVLQTELLQLVSDMNVLLDLLKIGDVETVKELLEVDNG